MRLSKIAGLSVLIAVLMLYAILEASQGQTPAQVTIKNFAFEPGTVTIARGSTVTWANQDTTTHTVKFGDEESKPLGKGQTYSKTFDTPGTFDYACGLHPSMKGKVIVK